VSDGVREVRSRPWARAASAAWILIVCLVGGVQFFRGAWIDGTIFAVAAAALIVDATGLLPPAVRALPRLRAALLVLAAAACAVVLVIAPRHGVVVGVLLAVIGVAAVVIAWPNRPPSDRDRWTPATRRAAVAWSVVALAACVWELTMYLLGTFSSAGRSVFPALSDLINPLADQPIGRVLLTAGWVGAGVFFLRRMVAK
jgi:hypothetical protein